MIKKKIIGIVLIFLIFTSISMISAEESRGSQKGSADYKNSEVTARDGTKQPRQQNNR